MTNFTDLSTALADAVEQAARSVVTVQAMRPVSGTVTAPGQVLTVAHLLHADEVTVVTPGGQVLTATVAGRDPGSDLALLRVDGLTAPALAAGPAPRVGELLLAVGRTGHGPQATLGFMERRADRGWLPTGAAPFRGVSGGALVSSHGTLVGVLNAGVSRGDLLAVPAERALRVAGLLGTSGRVPRGYLGLATQPVHLPTAGMEQDSTEAPGPHRPRGPGGGRPWGPFGPGDRGRGPWGARPGPDGRPDRDRFGQAGRPGLTVVQVEPGSPGEQAGLRVGDILLALDGTPMRHPRELLGQIRDRAGELLKLRVLRGGEEQDVTVTVGER
ncbi:S1C family serine protease [Deinococcus taeanensis]|uniref:S1C family serine protease n=1 Tax=Deinococcus taeanensis TaxID=2737050 RepID=UPI001CDBCEA3|nr:trypsin-like peptidase domain-containing protein [Deinococcus taeanensis]UBV43643.1 S1C family serine protease [Deinococcus taeanensis]